MNVLHKYLPAINQDAYRYVIKSIPANLDSNIQNVHTPFSLVKDMLNRLNMYWDGEGQIATFNIEFVESLIYDYGISPTKVIFITDCPKKEEFINNSMLGRYKGVRVFQCDFSLFLQLDVKNVMKFDVIVGNPPYQTNTDNGGAGHTLWDKFVSKAFDLVKEDGHVCLVHPSGWRNVDGAFKKTQNLMASKQIEYLEVHDIKDGQQTFGVSTRYDWYVIKNTDDKTDKTVVKFQSGVEELVDLNNFEFIPNGMIEEINKLVAKNEEERVTLIHSESVFEMRKPWMSEFEDDNFIYPCVKYINKANSIDLRYSSKSHDKFMVPKVMFGAGAQVGGIIIDYDGVYGLCQFTVGIKGDTVEELEGIQKALLSNKFKEVMKCCQFTTQMYNRKIIALFRKDFWKDFI